jgi:hypothetical protein
LGGITGERGEVSATEAAATFKELFAEMRSR